MPGLQLPMENTHTSAAYIALIDVWEALAARKCDRHFQSESRGLVRLLETYLCFARCKGRTMQVPTKAAICFAMCEPHIASQ